MSVHQNHRSRYGLSRLGAFSGPSGTADGDEEENDEEGEREESGVVYGFV